MLINNNMRGTCANRSQLIFLEAYYIKTLKPAINKEVKASKELMWYTVALGVFVASPIISCELSCSRKNVERHTAFTGVANAATVNDVA